MEDQEVPATESNEIALWTVQTITEAKINLAIVGLLKKVAAVYCKVIEEKQIIVSLFAISIMMLFKI